MLVLRYWKKKAKIDLKHLRFRVENCRTRKIFETLHLKRENLKKNSNQRYRKSIHSLFPPKPMKINFIELSHSDPLIKIKVFSLFFAFSCISIKLNCVQQIFFSVIRPPTNWINDKLPNKLHFLYVINIIHPLPFTHTLPLSFIKALHGKKNNFFSFFPPFYLKNALHHFLLAHSSFRLLLYLLINCH